MSATPWQIGDIPGPKQAHIIKPEMFLKVAKTLRRPLIVVGSRKEALEGKDIANYIVMLAKSINSPLAVSPSLFKNFMKFEDIKVVCMGIEDLVNRLKEKEWEGFDGKGNYDSVLFIGGVYYFQSLMLSTLKHFAPYLKTFSMDRFYHPNADFSFENMNEERWVQEFKNMVEMIKSSLSS
ncbi:MAG: CO dehydrogenase/acetyl-CoA synthase complex subunit epsilon [archaeon]|nr:CO dehydrogenase/acetyl-CoA synthase complex subunit epsilon [archaeon]MCP8315010.1 CO dehydrogenase/acetyl-CoA synthase complex subunit epsilon [archaeon]MCP8315632.1 CO dehydrogenase/acetyl-CoA synthase complex subunit epsilon [archaeon]MCP8321808.1 CO dehydrogenase/acetyl-CoA synthase complex subunit epsilon [archaeon]